MDQTSAVAHVARPLLEPARLDRIRGACAYRLCDACLGRLAARVERGLTNAERGQLLRKALERDVVPPADCWVCEGLVLEVSTFAGLVVGALDGLEYRTFLVGTRLDHDLAAREVLVREAHGGGEAEPLNQELNREIGKAAEPHLLGPAEFRTPEVTAIVDTRYDHVTLSIAPVFVAGRYRKLSREVPQSRWPCRACHGMGCRRCDGTGKQYASSVEQRIGDVLKAATDAKDYALHGAGREDIDARMLGTGRPFVLECSEPRRRHLDLHVARLAINADPEGAVEVGPLRFVPRAMVASLKDGGGRKEYRAEVALEPALPVETLKKACSLLAGSQVAQRTPSRVAHRRADLVRTRRVEAIEVESHEGARATLRIRGDAGLYIKELVNGDEGRTDPSLSGLLGVEARVTALDVIDVEGPPGFDDAAPAP